MFIKPKLVIFPWKPKNVIEIRKTRGERFGPNKKRTVKLYFLIINGAGSPLQNKNKKMTRQRSPPPPPCTRSLVPTALQKLNKPPEKKLRYFRQTIGTHSLFDFILEQTRRRRRRYDAVIIVDRVEKRSQQQNQGQARQNRRGEGTAQGA